MAVNSEVVETPLLVNETLSYKISKERRCIGYKDSDDSLHECKSLAINHLGSDGRCSNCKSLSKISNCSRCHGVCINPSGRSYCRQPHIVYLASFTPNFVKVGVSTEKRWRRRIAEQGANMAVIAAYARDGETARIAEAKIKEELGIPDRLHDSIHLQSLKTNFRVEELFNALRVQYQKICLIKFEQGIEVASTSDIYDLYTSYIQSMEVSKKIPQIYSGSRLLFGEIKAIKGWSILLSFKGSYSVFNLHNLVGHFLENSSEKPHETLFDYL